MFIFLSVFLSSTFLFVLFPFGEPGCTIAWQSPPTLSITSTCVFELGSLLFQAFNRICKLKKTAVKKINDWGCLHSHAEARGCDKIV